MSRIKYRVRITDESFAHDFGTEHDYSWDMIDWPKDELYANAHFHVSRALEKHTKTDVPWRFHPELSDEGVEIVS